MVTHSSTSLTTRQTLCSAKAGLQKVVEDLCETSEFAMARIWLVQTIDSCEICQSRSDFEEIQEPSLHLVASAGHSQNTSSPEVWNRLGGAFHRFPLNSQKIGHIGATGKPLLVHHATGETALLNPDWLTREGIQSFFGYPLASEGQIRGVFAVFSRVKLTERDLRFLKQIADGTNRLLEDASRFTEQDLRLHCLEFENDQLRVDREAVGLIGSLIVRGPASRKLDEQIQMAAAQSRPVLIRGERGSGKEFAASLIHARSDDRNAPFVKVNGHALSIELCEQFIQQDLPASNSHPAIGQLATLEHKPLRTLFIDGIEQTSPQVQEHLAQVLLSPSSATEREQSPVRTSNAARIIASSRVNLQTEVSAGRFRHDLYCALSVTEIEVPPLRQRPADLPVLAKEIISGLCQCEHRDPLELDAAAIDRLLHHDWPGNVRELQYVLGCAVTQSHDGRIALDGLLNSAQSEFREKQVQSFVLVDALKQQERANVIACLKRSEGKVYGRGGAAELLGMKPTTLLYRMKVLGIEKPAR